MNTLNIIVIFVSLALSTVNAQYEQQTQWTNNAVPADNWNANWDVDTTNDFQTLAYISPYGYGYDFDVDDYETLGAQSFSVPLTVTSSKKQQMSPVFETLPESFANPIYASEVVNTQVLEQPIKAPRIIRQPIIQQRLVEQPIYRTRVVNQPVIRRIVNQPIIRPTVTKTTTTKPYQIEQQVVQPKIYEQNVIRQTYQEKRENRQPIVEAATHLQQQQTVPMYTSGKY